MRVAAEEKRNQAILDTITKSVDSMKASSKSFLDLTGLNIRGRHLDHLFPLIEGYPLAELQLSKNKIDDEAAELIAETLLGPENTKVYQIRLDRNQIGPSGAMALASALKYDTTIRNLDLAFNPIGDMGGGYVATALLHNQSLVSLSLSSTNMTLSGAKTLAGALRRNPKLTALCFSKNVAKPELPEVDKIFHDLLLVNSHLTTIFLGPPTSSALRKLLQLNMTLVPELWAHVKYIVIHKPAPFTSLTTDVFYYLMHTIRSLVREVLLAKKR